MSLLQDDRSRGNESPWSDAPPRWHSGAPNPSALIYARASANRQHGPSGSRISAPSLMQEQQLRSSDDGAPTSTDAQLFDDANAPDESHCRPSSDDTRPDARQHWTEWFAAIAAPPVHVDPRCAHFSFMRPDVR